MDDQETIPPSWDEWTPQTSLSERISARTLLSLDVGDRIYVEGEPLTVDWEVYAITERDGYTHIHLDVIEYASEDIADEDTIDDLRMTATVVRGKYVFLWDRKRGYPVAVDWSQGEEPLMTPDDIVRAGDTDG